MTVEQIMEIIDQATEPSKMSKENALEFLDDLAEKIESRQEALRDEIADE